MYGDHGDHDEYNDYDAYGDYGDYDESDDGVVDIGWDLDLYADHIGLFSLDLLDLIPGFLHIGLLTSDGDHVRVRATLWQVNLSAEKMTHFRK